MRIFNLFPWRTLIRRIAHRKGFLDPLELLARLRRFSQPSEVQEPIELIRAGMVFHARGLVNTKVIQHNLDWIWPYWIVRQFSPDDNSFIPRAFSFSHVNLTHRNWTALGVPGCLELPIVDPRGMVTPHHDDWSVDHWFLAEDGTDLFPSTLLEVDQRLLTEDGHVVETLCENTGVRLELRSQVVWETDQPVLETRAVINARKAGRFVVSVRPCNPEGVQFIDEVDFNEDGTVLDVAGTNRLEFAQSPTDVYTSDYHHGDVLSHVRAGNPSRHTKCPAGLATAAAAYAVQPGTPVEVVYRIPIAHVDKELTLFSKPEPPAPTGWEAYMKDWTRIEIPDTRFTEIFESSKRTLALLSQSELLPGPYTYRRFWFRDACLIGNAMLGLSQDRLVRQALASFPNRQKMDGYFHSQEGEWDSNGQVLWLANRFEEACGDGKPILENGIILKAARWIDRKRRKTLKEKPCHRGLLPAGFSAEHLGPNDFYYWDDFWGAAGLRAAAAILTRRDATEPAQEAASMAEEFEQAILATLDGLDPERVGRAIPAAPTRRMDSGAIGSMVADYPLELDWIPRERIQATADWLLDHSLHKGGFFQNMIHSGINAYLTLDLAQTMLRYGDDRYWDLIEATARVASPTGKWPEAVHPNTEGGCMGDGEHAWAAAEWCQAMRALFIEETDPNTLSIGKGLPEKWLQQDAPMAFGPTLTRWGRVSVRMEKTAGKWAVSVEGDWNNQAPAVKVCLPGDFVSS
jgi:hypothetical protein